MIDAALEAFLIVLDAVHLLSLLVGITVGLFVGILPGLGGVVGMALLIPFLWGMDPSIAMALLMGMMSVLRTVDTIPGVLFAVPGTAGSQASIMDGYPMAIKGQAARALGAAFTASMIGGVFGAFALSLSLPIARPLIFSLGSPEFFMLTILGISMVGCLSGRKPLKGIVTGIFGLLIATVGGGPAGYGFRYTFDLPYLLEGFPLVVVALGLFAIPEITDLFIKGTSISELPTMGKGLFQGVKDSLRNIPLILRCSAIGTYIGFLPGLGAAPANWITYGHVVQSAKGERKFGKGDVRGVIGPEAANDASQGGALIPTLLFGIPGSAAMALFLFALMILDIDVGPNLLRDNMTLLFVIIWSLAIANIIASMICLLITKPLAWITTLSIYYWMPFVLMMVILGAFQATRHWGDLITLFAVSVFGWFMKQTSWPRPPLLIGFVLGFVAEKYFWISVLRYEANWLLRPFVIVIGIIIVVSVFMGLRTQKRKISGESIYGNEN